MAFLLLKIRQLDDLTADQLKYVSKPILLEYYKFQIRNIWNKLPNHIKADAEIQNARASFGLNATTIKDSEPSPILVKVTDLKKLPYEQIKYIPKTILLEYFEDMIDEIWDHLPTHIRLDEEIRDCRRCELHFPPTQTISVQKRKNCCICQAIRKKNITAKDC